MPFPWNDLRGDGPDRDTPEVSVFGPGFGECIVVHWGMGRWAVVDSCIDYDSRTPVSLAYFDAIGVDVASQVDFVFATHWHDDHVRGLSEVIRSCRHASPVFADALTKPEFFRFVARFAHNNQTKLGSGTNEFNQLHQTPQRIAWKRAGADRRILLHNGGCEIWTLSPSDEEYRRFIGFLGQELPRETAAKRRASAGTTNDCATAILVKWISCAALLGSDLEAHHGSARGWGAVVASAGRPQGRASYLKVPHHGGLSAHHEGMWQELLDSRPISVLTPFSRSGLPTIDDRRRILSLSSQAFATARGRATPVASDTSVKKTLDEAKIRLSRPPGLGLVRCRFQSGRWVPETFGEAHDLASAA